MAIDRKQVAERIKLSGLLSKKKKYNHSLNELLMTVFYEECDRDKTEYAATIESLVLEYLGYKELGDFLKDHESYLKKKKE